MEQLMLDIGVVNIDDALTDRQTDRQTAADARRENRQGKESVKACGRNERNLLQKAAYCHI